MKIYLQDCKTLKFIRCDSSWGSDINEAVDFISVRRATLYGLSELKEVFQLLQVEADGLQSRISPVIGQLPAVKLPVVKMVTVPRPVRTARTTCVAREIVERTGLWRSRRRPVQILPPMYPQTGELPWAGDSLHKAF